MRGENFSGYNYDCSFDFDFNNIYESLSIRYSLLFELYSNLYIRYYSADLGRCRRTLNFQLGTYYHNDR